jgi:hypothetical protein
MGADWLQRADRPSHSAAAAAVPTLNGDTFSVEENLP